MNETHGIIVLRPREPGAADFAVEVTGEDFAYWTGYTRDGETRAFRWYDKQRYVLVRDERPAP